MSRHSGSPSPLKLSIKATIGQKVAMFATAGAIGVLILSASVNIYEAQGLVDREIAKALNEAELIFAAKIEDQANRALTAASLVAAMPSVQRAMAARDRAALAAEFVPGFKLMNEQFDVQQMQFHLPPATSFLRVHRPARFGDDLSDIRPGVVESNASRKPVSGLEMGREGLGLRGIVPIAAEGRHVGTVEFGLSFDAALFKSFKRQSGIDVALYLGSGNELAYFAGSSAGFETFDLRVLAAAARGSRFIETMRLDGVPHAAIVTPVQDFSKRTIGISVKAVDRSDFDAALRHAWQVTAALAATVLLFALVTVWIINRTIGRPLSTMTGVMQKMSEGDLDSTYDAGVRRDEIGALAKALHRFRQAMLENKEMDGEQRAMLVRLSETATRVAESVDAIRAAASEISQGSNDLAARTERQASALQQTIATMGEISENVSTNARNSEQARTLAADALARAESGNGAVASVVQAMTSIETSSSRIADIIRVMEEISFQTKLLALNAAVEAARAGESGKGFAVVAQEVRALADRSRQASQQIRDLIAQSSKEVGQGVQLAGGAGEALSSIIEIVRRVAEIAPEIAAGSRAQARSIAEINKALNDLDAATQQNAALVEESSAAAASLAEQAGQLVTVAAGFRGGDDNAGGDGAASDKESRRLHGLASRG